MQKENSFDINAFKELCNCIKSLRECGLRNDEIIYKLHFIYGQVLKHLIYHFDGNDLLKIVTLPPDYMDHIEQLDYESDLYFRMGYSEIKEEKKSISEYCRGCSGLFKDDSIK